MLFGYNQGAPAHGLFEDVIPPLLAHKDTALIICLPIKLTADQTGRLTLSYGLLVETGNPSTTFCLSLCLEHFLRKNASWNTIR
jgi:hypothetical protein